jgi:hypothetical protein
MRNVTKVRYIVQAEIHSKDPERVGQRKSGEAGVL